MKFLNKLLGRKPATTNYVNPVLSDQQLAWIEFIDSSCVQNSLPITDGMGMDVYVVTLPLQMQWQSARSIQTLLSSQLEARAYIPRSVGFILDSYGNWQFLIGVRSETPADDKTLLMFTDILTRTNAVRSSE